MTNGLKANLVRIGVGIAIAFGAAILIGQCREWRELHDFKVRMENIEKK